MRNTEPNDAAREADSQLSEGIWKARWRPTRTLSRGNRPELRQYACADAEWIDFLIIDLESGTRHLLRRQVPFIKRRQGDACPGLAFNSDHRIIAW